MINAIRPVCSDTRFDKAKCVVVRPQRTEFLFYNSRTDELHLIPNTGNQVFGLCDGVRTVDEIFAEISPALDAEASSLKGRLTEFLGALEARGLVERVHG